MNVLSPFYNPTVLVIIPIQPITKANNMLPININLGLRFIGSGLGYNLAGLDIFTSSFIFPKSYNASPLLNFTNPISPSAA